MFLLIFFRSIALYKINLDTLFRKLLDQKTPIMLIRILLFWYTKQNMCMKWGNCMSDYLTWLAKEESYNQNCILCMSMMRVQQYFIEIEI